MTQLSPALPAHEPAVSQYVPYSHHVTDAIVATRDWEYLSVWRIDGRTFQGYSEEEHCLWIEEINNVLRGWPAGFGLWSHLVRRCVSEYPASEYPDAFSRAHDAAYRSAFDGKPPMINEMYLTILMRAQVDPALRLLSNFERRTASQALAWQNQAISHLEEINKTLAGTLKRYSPELLKIVERTVETEGDITEERALNAPDRKAFFSEPAEFFGFLLNGKISPVPVTDARLYNYLPTSRQFFSTHGEQAEMRGPDWTRRYVMLEVREYSNNTKPGHLNSLLNLPFEFVLSQSFGSMPKAEGLKALTRQIKWLEDSGDYSASQIVDLKRARDDLSSGKFVMGDHHATLQVFGENSEHALRAAAEISGTLASSEIVARLVDRALIAGWAAQLPGNWKWRPRPCPITSLNFLCFSSMHNYLYGKPAGNPWGPAVTMLKTTGGTPYYMNFHASLEETDDTGKRRLGNTSLIGKSGTGKTVMLGHLISQARKFGYTGAVFDKDRGMQVAILQMGGRYFPMHMGTPTGWNYLQLEPTAKNIAFMVTMTKQLAVDGEQAATMSEQKQIEAAVQKLVSFLPRSQRRLSTLLQFLPAAPSEGATLSLRERLQRWCVGYANGWLLDNETDQLDLSVTNLFGFDLTEFLDYDEIRDAAITYLLYRTEQMVDGRRFAYFFDEVQHPLRVPYFQWFMQNVSRTIRKKNGVFVYATQEPEAVSEIPVGRSMIQQSATQMYLPNPEATAATYIDQFKLTPAEFKLVKELGEFSRQFVVKQGGSSVTATLDLSTCPDSILVFSGSADMAELADQAIVARGGDPEQWLPLYLSLAREATRN
ncbi:VirB4 family type IV secretion/conjugal transfer ATPase [Achromobacter xylosoxidans]|jgi:type IV secretion system protein VirB4|uniref:VirB4 family type IV secretion/conjugal transfer ATPase n=1 Tax=Achromobacter TaxID=222 RepID=UPI0006C7244E|nr:MULTISPECIES: VirB4 family type IV secretion/conjugal transfer ATPase [Achromobacter]MDZ5618033.1 VirB4 family type IV secretion/conjugal transfer ATPase [Achromobacter xylosoxidans]MDZ5625878.1 VirB4 family type IV secretion/conjugal transfer ATPase [Achromobacter xylosoxidans]MDZ5685468.1 VirB4 family type IV secretion/conjugal transfer ATPase [Achromobacter xylosoxidans]CUJ71051.1 Pertussis toxin liberation protein C [Achromobacter sp. 2789STDY5608621]